MNRIFTAAIAVAAAAFAGAIPAKATTFPSLTPIYFASGAADLNLTAASGMTTLVSCTNMSGQIASVRYQFRKRDGTPSAGATLALANLATHSITSQGGLLLAGEIVLPTDAFFGGSIQILSTQSAIYCSALLVNASTLANGTGSEGMALHMVRFNPHPGTVE